MEVTNITGRDIFLGVKDRRLQDVEDLRRGVSFPAGGTITVSDALRLSPDFDALVVAGKLIIAAFGTDPTSTVQQEELEGLGGGVDDLLEVVFTPTLGQTIFLLPTPYAAGGFARAKVNTAWYDKPDFFTIAGSLFTWLNVGFSLDSSDDLLVWYEI